MNHREAIRQNRRRTSNFSIVGSDSYTEADSGIEVHTNTCTGPTGKVFTVTTTKTDRPIEDELYGRAMKRIAARSWKSQSNYEAKLRRRPSAPGTRARQSRSAPARSRGSRRAAATGSSSSSTDPGDSDPPGADAAPVGRGGKRCENYSRCGRIVKDGRSKCGACFTAESRARKKAAEQEAADAVEASLAQTDAVANFSALEKSYFALIDKIGESGAAGRDARADLSRVAPRYFAARRYRDAQKTPDSTDLFRPSFILAGQLLATNGREAMNKNGARVHYVDRWDRPPGSHSSKWNAVAL